MIWPHMPAIDMHLDIMAAAFVGWMLAAAACEGIRRWWRHHANPYRWHCPDCSFRVEGNDPVWVATVTTTHIHQDAR